MYYKNSKCVLCDTFVDRLNNARLCPECADRSVSNTQIKFDSNPRLLKQTMALAGIPERYLNAKLTDFSDIPVKLSRNLGVMCEGEAGVGKTHLLTALVREVIRSGYGDVRFIGYSHMLREFRDNIFDPAYFESLLSTEYLFIDDIGVSKLSPFTYERVYELVDTRYNEMLHTSFSCNKGAMEGFDDRLIRRIASSVDWLNM